MIGGIGVGYSAGYAWQTAFNTFWSAVHRIRTVWNAGSCAVAYRGPMCSGAAYTMILNKLGDKIRAVYVGTEKSGNLMADQEKPHCKYMPDMII